MPAADPDSFHLEESEGKVQPPWYPDPGYLWSPDHSSSSDSSSTQTSNFSGAVGASDFPKDTCPTWHTSRTTCGGSKTFEASWVVLGFMRRTLLGLLIDHRGSGTTSTTPYAFRWSLSGTGRASTTLAASSAPMGFLRSGRGAGSTSTSLARFAGRAFRFPALLETSLTWDASNTPFYISIALSAPCARSASGSGCTQRRRALHTPLHTNLTSHPSSTFRPPCATWSSFFGWTSATRA